MKSFTRVTLVTSGRTFIRASDGRLHKGSPPPNWVPTTGVLGVAWRGADQVPVHQAR